MSGHADQTMSDIARQLGNADDVPAEYIDHAIATMYAEQHGARPVMWKRQPTTHSMIVLAYTPGHDEIPPYYLILRAPFGADTARVQHHHYNRQEVTSHFCGVLEAWRHGVQSAIVHASLSRDGDASRTTGGN